MYYIILVPKRDLLNMTYLYFTGAAGVEIWAGRQKSPQGLSEPPAGKHRETSRSKYIFSIYTIYTLYHTLQLAKIEVKSG